MKEIQQFGLSPHALNNIKLALELQEFYGLDDTLSSIAFDLYKKKGYSLRDTFAYMDQVSEQLQAIDVDAVEFAWNSLNLYGFFNCRFSLDLTRQITDKIPLTDAEICSLPPHLVQSFAHQHNMSFSKFLEYYKSSMSS